MKRARTRFRVRYPEIDRMGVAHHSCYFVWFELGRTELMREAGLPYRELEDLEQILFPVVEASARYLSSACYDEELEVETVLAALDRLRARFEYRILRPGDGTILAEGHTLHVSSGPDGRPRRLPKTLLTLLGVSK